MRLLLKGVLLGICASLTTLLPGAVGTRGYGSDEGIIPVPSPTVVAVMVADMSYDPRTVVVLPGDIVTWSNYGLYAHTVTADPGGPAGGPDSGRQFPNGLLPSLSYSWSVPVEAVSGTKWFYHCRFYGQPGDGKDFGLGMSGEIEVK